jgi:signal transduction histidine kinase
LQGKVNPKEEDILLRMIESTTQLSKTIKDLSEVAKAQREEQTQDLIRIEEVFRDVEQEVSQVFHAQEISVETSFETMPIHYAHSHLRSILYNLISNAVKYSSPSRAPRIWVRTWQENGLTHLAVSDNGLGLDPEQVQKLFRMFKRLHNHVEGTG